MSQRLIAELDRVAARWRWATCATAVAWVVGVGLAVAMLLAGVDWLGRFNDPGLRWLFSGVLIASIGTAIYRGWNQLRSLQATRLTVARKAEELHPELGSRLASAVEFYDGASDDPTAGSEELRRAVIVDAAAQVEGGLSLDETLDPAPLHKATWFLGTTVAALVLFFALNAPAMLIGFTRLVQPWADVDWPRQNQLELVEVVTTVAAGELFEVAVIDLNGPLPDDVQIEYTFKLDEKTPPTTESTAMQLIGDQAVARRESVRRPFSYRIVGGDDKTMAWTDVAVVEPPQLVELKINATPPAYSGLPPQSLEGAIRVLAGTVCTAQGTANQPVLTASIELPDDETIALTIDDASSESPHLATTDSGWIAKTSESAVRLSTLRVAIEGTDGLIGHSSPRPYEVIADEPPTIKWLEPSGDQFVTERAIVSIKVEVKDNLATRLVTLRGATIATSPEATEEEATQITPVRLLEGTAEVPERETIGTDEQRIIERTIDLLDWDVQQGRRLDLLVEATDYRPSTGTTELPRRVFIVSDEEVEARLAQKQSRLLAEVQRALERQRSAQNKSNELSIDAEAGGKVNRKTLDRLATLEFEQRQASGAIDDPRAGAWQLAKELIALLRQNRLSQPDLEQQLAAVSKELGQLAQGVLPEARRRVAAVRRTAKRSSEMREMSPALRSAVTAQTEAAERLEAVAEALTGWADYQRFAGEIAKLRDQQRNLAETTSGLAIAAATGDPMAMAENRSEQQKALASQAEISRRFTTLRKAMRRLLNGADLQDDSNPAGARDAVSDALTEAEERNLASELREASRNLARERFGRAQAPQERAAEGLEKMLEALRGRTESDPAEMIQQLREAQERLAELERQANEMRQQGQDAPQQREQMAKQAERIARALERMEASAAAGSTQQGAQSLSGPQSNQEKLAQAEQDFQEAQKQIEEKIAELEDEQTERMLDRLMAQIDGYIERQLQVNEAVKSVEIVGGDLGQAVDRLGEEQTTLEEMVRESASDLARRAVFEMALNATANEMRQVVERLSTLKLDRTTHRHGAMALSKLKRIAEVLRSTPPPQEPQDKEGGGGGEGGGEKPPSPIDVAELKMLRMMQLDLIDQTETFELETDPAQQDWQAEARHLREEQRRLAELALEMAERNNDPDADQADEAQ